MIKIEIDGVSVRSTIPEFDQRAAEYVIGEIKRDEQFPIKNVVVELESNGNWSVEWDAIPPKFERIRRITGYLVGTMDRWNDAKRAEEAERVKHE